MATAPPKPCAHPGCGRLVPISMRRCPEHQALLSRTLDAARKTSHERGYNKRWHDARIEYLNQHRHCVECSKDGVLTVATVVDHIVPHKGDMVRFWQRDNWQSLCRAHHASKTAREDGRWG
jgi:5-methylcytosine-specific restriction enzyme A